MRTLVFCAVALFAAGCADIDSLESEPETESAPTWVNLGLQTAECDPEGTPEDTIASCDDGDPCTIDRCAGGSCVSYEVGNCD